MDEFRGLDRDIEGSAKRWKKWVDSECPEKEKFPQEWKSKTSFQKLIMLRALRPDRMTYALRYCMFDFVNSFYIYHIYLYIQFIYVYKLHELSNSTYRNN